MIINKSESIRPQKSKSQKMGFKMEITEKVTLDDGHETLHGSYSTSRPVERSQVGNRKQRKLRGRVNRGFYGPWCIPQTVKRSVSLTSKTP